MQRYYKANYLTKKFELHLHNAENSGCATAPAKDIARVYRDAGYGGVFVTNHYNKFAFHYMTGGKATSWKNLIDKYLYGYRTIKEEGEKIGLKVLLGAEVSPSRYQSSWDGDYPGMEFLMYGFDEKFLYDTPNMCELSQEGLFELANRHNLLMCQAHPFRPYVALGDPKFMHGAEVFNKQNEYYDPTANGRAEIFATEHNLKKIAGTDFHHLKTAQEGLSGVWLPASINTPQEFVQYAKENELEFV